MAEHAYDPKEATTLRETANHVEIAIAKLEGRPQQDAQRAPALAKAA